MQKDSLLGMCVFIHCGQRDSLPALHVWMNKHWACVFVASLLLPWKYLKSKPHSNVQVCVEKQCVGDPCKKKITAVSSAPILNAFLSLRVCTCVHGRVLSMCCLMLWPSWKLGFGTRKEKECVKTMCDQLATSPTWPCECVCGVMCIQTCCCMYSCTDSAVCLFHYDHRDVTDPSWHHWCSIWSRVHRSSRTCPPDWTTGLNAAWWSRWHSTLTERSGLLPSALWNTHTHTVCYCTGTVLIWIWGIYGMLTDLT